MEIVWLSLVAFIVSILTFFSGFGLGTILTPVFMVYFPVDIAIGLTGVVHFINNIFKLTLVGRSADKSVVIRFGIPAILAAIAGAWLLLQLPNSQPLFNYRINGKLFEVYPVKLMISILLICFALLDIIPARNKIQFEKRHMPVGGVLSGFFGGLSGNQGALRSAFLIRAGLSKEVFIATAVVLSCMVDFTRLTVYATKLPLQELSGNAPVIVSAAASAIAGAFIGHRLLKKVTLKFVQLIIAIMLILLSIALGMGIV